MYLWLTIVPGGSSAVLEKKKEGREAIRDSWQCGISCVHIHRACCRLGAEMLPEAYRMCSRILYAQAHKATHSLQYLQAQTIKLSLPLLSNPILLNSDQV